MENFLIIKNEESNDYYIENNHSLMGFLHPSLCSLLTQKENINIPDVDYYQRKINYFKKNGLFGDENIEKQFNKTFFTPQLVEESIASTEQIVFEVTEKCDLQCYYCAYRDMYDKHEVRVNKNMKLENAFYLWDELNKIFKENKNKREGVLTIGFYGGEPLLNSDFIKKLTTYIKQTAEFPIKFNMTTNGMHLKQYADFLNENKFQLLISIDGNSKNNSYRKMKNNIDSFPYVLQNIDYLRDNYPLYFKEYVNFNSVLHNKNNIYDIYNFIFNRYGKVPRIGVINPDGIIDKVKYDSIAKSFIEDFETSNNKDVLFDVFFTLFPIYRDIDSIFRKFQNLSITELKELSINGNRKILPTGTCLPFNKKIFITVNNKLLVCEKIDYSFALSEFMIGSRIFDFKKIANIYNQYYSKIIKTCSTCYKYNICNKCIFSMSKNLNSPIYKCSDYANKQQMEKYLSLVIGYMEKHPKIMNKILN